MVTIRTRKIHPSVTRFNVAFRANRPVDARRPLFGFVVSGIAAFMFGRRVALRLFPSLHSLDVHLSWKTCQSNPAGNCSLKISLSHPKDLYRREFSAWIDSTDCARTLCVQLDSCQATGRTSAPSTSTAMERWISSTESTKRKPPFLRSRIP